MPIITDCPASSLDVVKAAQAPGSQLQEVGRQTAWHKRQHSQNKSRAIVKENCSVRGRNANWREREKGDKKGMNGEGEKDMKREAEQESSI